MKRAFFLVALVACKGSTESASDAAPAATTVSSASAPAASSPPPPSTTAWSGSYDAQIGSFYVPDGAEWKGVRFRGEDAGDGLGQGTLKLSVAPDGTVSGEGEGALGAFTVSGTSREDAITFSVHPKDAMGFSGTGAAKVEADKLTGSMRVSKATGNVIREAAFALRR